MADPEQGASGGGEAGPAGLAGPHADPPRGDRSLRPPPSRLARRGHRGVPGALGGRPPLPAALPRRADRACGLRGTRPPLLRHGTAASLRRGAHRRQRRRRPRGVGDRDEHPGRRPAHRVVGNERRRHAGRPHPRLARVLEPRGHDAALSMVADKFAAVFGRAPDVVADAPGRVNLIGEHTDYNGGPVLPTAIPQRASAAVGRRDDARVRAVSLELGGGVVDYRLGEERHGRGWLDYVQGLTYGLGRSLTGFDLLIDSRVPIGGGLASSAALEIAVLRALRGAFGLALDDLRIALLAQRAENEFVGARVGIMDQMAASLAEERSALHLDTHSLAWRRVPLPAALEVVVMDSGASH